MFSQSLLRNKLTILVDKCCKTDSPKYRRAQISLRICFVHTQNLGRAYSDILLSTTSSFNCCTLQHSSRVLFLLATFSNQALYLNQTKPNRSISNCCIHTAIMMSIITVHIQMQIQRNTKQRRTLLFRYERFINFLTSVFRHEERDNS